MSGTDPTELVVAGTGRIWDAPVGTAFPASISVAPDPDDWVDLGFTTEDAVHLVFDRTTNDILAWQSRDPIRTIVTAEPKNFEYTLMQWNQNTFALAAGGGVWTEGAPGEYSYEPPDTGELYNRAQIVELDDDDKHYRFCFRNVLNKAPLDIGAIPTDTANLPINMSVLASTGVGEKPYLIQSDDPALETLLGS